MRFMIMVRANAQSEAGTPPDPALMAAMADYHEQLAKAGVLLDCNGLQPGRTGWRIDYRDGKPHVTDGPYGETQALIAGYTLIQVRSRDEALEWARRFPAPFGPREDSSVEVRPLFEFEDFAPNEAVERFRDLAAQNAG